MRRVAAVALVVAGFTLPACAQRFASHGGFAGRSGPAFHAGFAAPHFSGGFASPHFYSPMSAPRYPVRSFTPSPFIARPSGADRGFYPAPGFRAAYRGAEYRRGDNHGGGGGGVHFIIRSAPPYAVPAWFGLGPLGYYPYDFGYDDDAAFADESAANESAPQYEEQQPEESEPTVYREDYEPTVEAPQPSPVVGSESPTTIVFKDGRPSEQIHNYALTPTMLYVLDEQRRDIPLAQVDLAATEKVNRNAGIEFQVPQLVQ